MKKFYSFLFAAVALVGFAACNSDSTEEVAPKQEVGKMEFTANVDEATKTTLNGNSVLWCADDALWVNSEEFIIKDKENYTPATTAKFVGGEVEAPYVAVYPYSAFKYFDGVANVTLNLTANVAAGTFADGANIALAFSDDTNLSFKNLLSVLKFQVEADCETVTISSTSALVGKVVYNATDGTIAAFSTTDADKAIELTIDGGFKAGKTYYTTVVPGTHALTILTNGYLSTSKDSKTIVKNKIYNLGTLPVDYRVYFTPAPNSSAYSWTNANLWAWTEGGDNYTGGTWPGIEITDKTTTINGCKYYYCDMPDNAKNKDVKFIISDTKQTGDLGLGKLDSHKYVIYSTVSSEVYSQAPKKVEQPAKLYLVPNSNWKTAGRMAVALMTEDKSKTTWASMTKVNGDLYEVTIPEDTNKYMWVIFCRMNGSTTENKWENKWDQTNDLVLQFAGNNCWTIASGGDVWSYGDGSWSKK